jgi:hypothetical protein
MKTSGTIRGAVLACSAFAAHGVSAGDLSRCTIKDVVEITSIGTIGRRPTLTQAEMTMHPTFTVERSTGMLRSTRFEPTTAWILVQPGSEHDDLVTMNVSADQSSRRAPSELVRIQASNGRDRTFFLWFGESTLTTGDCETD